MAAEFSIDDVRQWEIWQVYWDHGDGTGKDRPALAITTAEQNRVAGFARFVKITGEHHPDVPCRLQISSGDPHFPHTGLDYTSWIHFLDDGRITSSNLKFRRGHISALTAAYLRMRLMKLAGLK
jgi:mRNA-degrading endonuclease toxin of MazEF toxin-antitoxin module